MMGRRIGESTDGGFNLVRVANLFISRITPVKALGSFQVGSG